jgi:hypothetical protein
MEWSCRRPLSTFIVERWSKFTGRAAVLVDDGRTFDELADARRKGVAA